MLKGVELRLGELTMRISSKCSAKSLFLHYTSLWKQRLYVGIRIYFIPFPSDYIDSEISLSEYSSNIAVDAIKMHR